MTAEEYRTEGAYTPSVDEARHMFATGATWQHRKFSTAAAEFDRMIAQVRAEERERIVRDLRAKFGITNRAADWVERSGKEQDRD